MTRQALKRAGVLFPAVAPLLLTGCVVWKSDYDAEVAKNQQLQQEIVANRAHITRLQDAIKYTVNSDLLFPSGGWQLSADGKDVIAKMAKMLAPGQQETLVVNGYTDNAPIGPALERAGVTSNLVLSQKRAETVMQYMISQGVRPELVSARGHGEADPIAANNTPKGRAENRRVEITIAHGS